MIADPVGLLLQRLAGGDEAAAAEVFRAYEPLLRKVVRRQLLPALRVKFDSADVVQSVWADLLDRFRSGGGRFDSAEHLRAFLVRATRNRFLDRLRQQAPALAHQRPLDDPAPARQPGPESGGIRSVAHISGQPGDVSGNHARR